MARRPLVLVHGYSDKGESFAPWCTKLAAGGLFPVETLSVCSYESLTNEVTIKDVGEAFDRALAAQTSIKPDDEFDVIVHSTGMLVIRAWLTGRDRSRIRRLKHLIAIAPATFGSPLAHKGRSTLASFFKGNRKVGPDFLEAGDQILDGLELGSRFQWDLTHRDVFVDEPVYGAGSDTPWVFTFCGTEAYTGLRRLINEPGTDGTVRWTGCSLNCRKVQMDLTKPPTERRVDFGTWKHVAAPTVLLKDMNHSSIVSNPTDELVRLVTSALDVNTLDDYRKWQHEAAPLSQFQQLASDGEIYQQFIVRATDERGDPVRDYHVEVFTREGDDDREGRIIEAFGDAPHPYTADRSLCCFHVNLAKVANENLENLWLRVFVSSGSALVAYQGHGTLPGAADKVIEVGGNPFDGEGSTELEIDLSEHLPKHGQGADAENGSGVGFFEPFTTTLVELRFNREPFPFVGTTKLLRWLKVQDLVQGT
jgi:hypothetical protein